LKSHYGKTWLVVLLASLLTEQGVLAIDYKDEYGDEPEPTMIELVVNLQEQAALARKEGIPLLIEFSSPWCGYCEALEKEVLEPMLKNNQFRKRVILRKLEVNDYSSVIDFTGQSRLSVNLAMSMKVDLYPTLVFFNGRGEEIGQRLVGITVLEFVSDELEKGLAQAQEEL
jgi:thioredoxin-related protein